MNNPSKTKGDTMLAVSVKINRPASVVWDYFTTTTNWSKWYGGVKAVSPSWQQGAKILWESGGTSAILKLIPGQEFVLYGTWMDQTYRFVREGNSVTVVHVIESPPKGGASFTDGGIAHRSQLEAMLQKFKKFVEEETNPISDEGKKWWQFWK